MQASRLQAGCGRPGQEAFLLLFITMHRAFVIRANVLTKVRRMLLAQGKGEVEAGRRAGWAALLTGKKLTRGTKGQLFERQHCRTALGRQGLSPSFAKTMTAAAW